MATSNANSHRPCVLVTGGGTGIGRAIAERFLREGWRVVAMGRRPEPLQNLGVDWPGQVLPLPCDLTDSAKVKVAIANLFEEYETSFGGNLTALINNAGIFERRSFLNSDDNLWRSMFETNLLGSIRLTRAVLPILEKNSGVVINVSSTVGLKPVQDMSAYAALKAAMINWTKSLALEAAPKGVRANCVCPGIVDTPIHSFHSQSQKEKSQVIESQLDGLQPLGRIGQPQDVAHGVWSLCAPGSEWITGSVLSIDGGIGLV